MAALKGENYETSRVSSESAGSHCAVQQYRASTGCPASFTPSTGASTTRGPGPFPMLLHSQPTSAEHSDYVARPVRCCAATSAKLGKHQPAYAGSHLSYG